MHFLWNFTTAIDIWHTFFELNFKYKLLQKYVYVQQTKWSLIISIMYKKVWGREKKWTRLILDLKLYKSLKKIRVVLVFIIYL